MKKMESAKIAPLAVYLASDAAAKVSGQIFGVRANEIYFFSQIRMIRSRSPQRGLDAGTIAEHAMPAFESSFLPNVPSMTLTPWDPIWGDAMETVGIGFYFEDLPVGRQFQTVGRTVTETDIVGFINADRHDRGAVHEHRIPQARVGHQGAGGARLAGFLPRRGPALAGYDAKDRVTRFSTCNSTSRDRCSPATPSTSSVK